MLFLVGSLCRFLAFDISAVDFSVFDGMLYSSNHGRFMYAPVFDLDHFGVHPSYAMIPLVPLHRAFESPLLLVLLNPLLLWAAAWPLWKLSMRLLQSEAWALLTVAAYLSCPWTGYLLNDGFRIESFYPLFGFYLALTWVQQQRGPFLFSALAFGSVKEDAALYLGAMAVGALLLEPKRRREALALLGGSLALFLFNTLWVQPHFLHGAGKLPEVYGKAWGEYGHSLGEIAVGMVSSPVHLLRQLLTSGWPKIFLPALLLPLLPELPLWPMLTALFVLGSSAYAPMHDYRYYYPVVLMPFLFWGLLQSDHRLRRWKLRPELRRSWQLGALLLFPLVGVGYLKFHRPNDAAIRALNQAQAALERGSGPLCTQAVIFPHLAYRLQPQLLTRTCLQRPGARLLINPDLVPYPLESEEVSALLEKANASGKSTPLGENFTLVQQN